MKEETKKETENFKLTSFENIKVEEVEWLWYPYIPLGKITILAGDPGVGKSFITTNLAGIISRGGSFPLSETSIEASRVIIQNGEDGAGDTIKKRLITFEANCNNIYMIETTEEQKKRGTILLRDIEEIEKAVIKANPKLLIFDPITSFTGNIDMNNASAVRTLLMPISKLAEKYNCAVLFVMHRNKGNNTNSLHRLLGSVDFAGVARSVISVGKNNDKTEVLFMHTKHNLSPKGETLAFNITDDTIKWLGTRGFEEDTYYQEEQIKQIRPRDLGKKVIIETLQGNGAMRYEQIEKKAIEIGISLSTLERARDELQRDKYIHKQQNGREVLWDLVDVTSFPQG